MRTFILALLIGLMALASTAHAAEPAIKPAKLSEQDRADIGRIEEYLNNLKSVSANFVQFNENSQILRGTIAIKRPGKMRVTYDAPNRDFIVADGSFVHIWNDELKAQTNVPEDSSLADLILRKNVKLSGDLTVTKFERLPAKLEVTLTKTDDPGEGQITLVFEDRPLLLREWRVIDAQGIETDVSLENEREGIDFPDHLFTFVPPSFKGSQAYPG